MYTSISLPSVANSNHKHIVAIALVTAQRHEYFILVSTEFAAVLKVPTNYTGLQHVHNQLHRLFIIP